MPCARHGENCDSRCVDPNVDNGMMTKVWGPAGWLFLHCVTFGYPYTINKDNKDHLTKPEDYYKFFYYLGKVLPCKYCRDSYMEFFATLNLQGNLDTRENLVRWLYDMHNKVNHKLGTPECNIPTFEALKDKYERYRAKCKKTSEEEREVNKSKGCVAPADGTAKRCVVKVINFNKGDITRRNKEIVFDDIPNQDEYILLHKNKLYYIIGGIILIILLIIILIAIFLKLKIKLIKWK